MFGERFELNEQTLAIVEQIGKRMPGGFFIYKEEQPEEVLYANRATLDIYGCADLREFKELTGNVFKGMVHPDDYDEVVKSIDDQILGVDDKLDYAEFRIIRRDGSVRWVDDYGHYTKTVAYGGIFYVFISDITEKREQLESDLAVRSAVIQALSEAYHTVWMINDVETESFSLYRGDIEGKTTHAVPIKDALGRLKYSQAKEYYINTTVAPSDRERLQRELSLDSIVERLKQKPQFNINYLRLMEDGSERYFRIEFTIVNMPNGKIGVVCGFKDVDDDVREGQAVQKALLDEERQRARQDKMITALASDYWSVYYVELDKNEGVCYQSHPDIDGLQVGERFNYLDIFTSYAEKYITEKYRSEFLAFTHPDSIREGLKSERVISYRYMVKRKGKESYEMVRFAGVRHPEDRDDHIVHAVGACFTDVDAETRRAIAQESALRDALSAAEDASRAKTAFLSSMSHEIRTPMNAIIGLDNIALNDPEITGKTREYLEKINASAQHLLSLINDILDLSRIETGRMTIKNEEFSFSSAIEQVNTMIGGQCRDKGLSYECRVEGAVCDYYRGDEMKLRQILINILGNSVKFTPAGGSVIFGVKEIARFDGKSTLRFTMEDTGVGMSPEFLEHIFDPFSQEDSSVANKYGSTGLGMPITKNLVELMNGNISVVSEKGKGTAFTVTITFDDSDRTVGAHDDGVIDPHKMSVLIIDDDPVAREHSAVVIGQIGAHCESASSGEEGIRMVEMRHNRRAPYDLILVDWRMQGVDGVETTRRIRSVIGNESAIVILTSYNWHDIADQAKNAGVDDFIAKPLFASNVLDKFREVFRIKNKNEKKPKAELEGRRILLAEDVAVNAEIMIMVLAMRGMETDVAENGKIAVELFSGHEPGYYDAVLMDMRMPVMDGLEATRTIRAMERPDAAVIPIIALTANAFDEDVQRSMQAGLNAHLSKPVDPETLFSTLETFIE